MLGALETGTDGVVLRTGSSAEVGGERGERAWTAIGCHDEII